MQEKGNVAFDAGVLLEMTLKACSSKLLEHYEPFCWNNAIVEQKLLLLSICRTNPLPADDVTMLVLALVLRPYRLIGEQSTSTILS